MSRPVRIGNAHGFWGDRIDAAAEMLAAEPELDYITLDFLAEVSMSLLAAQRARDSEAGWPSDVADVIRSLIPYWRAGGQCRLITNGGGLNPAACARAVRHILNEGGCERIIVAVVTGDDVLDQLANDSGETSSFCNLDTHEPLSLVQSRLVTANAYLGSQPIAEALACGADIVITGRVADPSLTVAACAHFHAWSWNDWPRLAGATVAGHLIECGAQVTGGISTDWLELPENDLAQIGFPIVEVSHDGSFLITKPRGSGGCVTLQTVKEQLVYEIGDPDNYLSPDATVSFQSIVLAEESRDRIRVSGAVGRPAPEKLKVSATYRNGFRAQGELTIYGTDAVAKARRAGNAVLNRLRSKGVTFRETCVECLGTGECHPAGSDQATASGVRETVLRIAVADESRDAVEKFSRELMPLITAGPPGTTGYSAGRPRVQPVFRYWPCLIERSRVTPHVELLVGPTHIPSGSDAGEPSSPDCRVVGKPESTNQDSINVAAMDDGRKTPPTHLRDIALARSGDKGIHANIGVIARHPDDYSQLLHALSIERVAAHLGISDVERVTRYELPKLGAVNFVVRNILTNSLKVDAQGKTLGQVMLEMPLTR